MKSQKNDDNFFYNPSLNAYIFLMVFLTLIRCNMLSQLKIKLNKLEGLLDQAFLITSIFPEMV